MRSILIYNPTAGRRRSGALLPRLVESLTRGGFRVEPAATDAPGSATALAREAAADGVERVFVLGGDGTVREAAVGLQGTETALGILPGGTVNVLGRALGLPRHPLLAAERMGGCAPHRFDVGRCGGTPFLTMASSGLDAEIMAKLNPARKARLGQLGILADGLFRWWGYGYPEIHLTADGRSRTATLAVASNIPLYGGSFRLAPEALWDDGLLDLVLFRGPHRGAMLSFAVSLAFGRHIRRKDVEILRVSEVIFEGPESIPLQIDGDVCTEALPARLSVASEPVWVLAPC